MSELKTSTPCPNRVPKRLWFAVLAATFLLYALTANRAAQWQDSGYHILRVVTGETLNPLGLALSHPLHHWLCRLSVAALPIEPAFAVTLISSLAAAIAVANVFGCTLFMVGHRGIALWAALSLAVANVFWQLATIAETYTLATALLSAECWCLVAFIKKPRRASMVGLLFFNGLGIANHMLAVLTVPVIGVLLILAIKRNWATWRDLAVAACCWLIGASPYLYMILEQFVQTGDPVGTIQSALFGKAFAGSVLNVAPPVKALAISIAFMALSFPNLLLPAAAFGMWRSADVDVSKTAKYALLGALATHMLFAVRYNVVDQYMFFAPSYVLLTIFGGIGAAAWLAHPRAKIAKWASVLLLVTTPVVSAMAPALAHRSSKLNEMVHRKPYRDDFVYLLTPWSVVKDSAEVLSNKAVDLAGDNGLIVIEDGMARFAVRYRALMSHRSGVEITTEKDSVQMMEALDAGKPVILVPLDRDNPKTPPPNGFWMRVGDLYRLHQVGSYSTRSKQQQ